MVLLPCAEVRADIAVLPTTLLAATHEVTPEPLVESTYPLVPGWAGGVRAQGVVLWEGCNCTRPVVTVSGRRVRFVVPASPTSSNAPGDAVPMPTLPSKRVLPPPIHKA